MKTFLLCACVLLLASFTLADVKQRLKSAMSSFQEDIGICITENNLVSDDWYSEQQITTNLHVQPGNEQRTRKCGCTIACVLKKRNMMEGSNIKEIIFHEIIDNEAGDAAHTSEVRQQHKIIHKCIKEVKNITDECEKGFSLWVCMTKAIHIAHGHDEHIPEEEGEEREKEP